ncbi:PAS domain S-box protein [Litchfieldia alkalitelluris]|uniref:PAS domain S-box protein n=1 Tax=Litchfieldia alkalitelluris TaxID=304268 RepID=UPI00099679B1|nr:PAS domain S-box protein [Litchfieldia alkalitelluris]
MDVTQRIMELKQAFIALNEDLEIIYCSNETEKLIEKPKEVVIGSSLLEVIPEFASSLCLKEIKEAINQRELFQFQEYYPILNRWLEIRVYPGLVSSNIYIVDVTDQIMNEKILDGKKIILEMISKGKPLDDVLHKVVGLIEELLTGGICSVLLQDDTSQKLRVKAAPSLPSEFEQIVSGITVGPNSNGCGKAAYFKKKVIIQDVSKEDLSPEVRSFFLINGIHSYWSTPIIDSNGNILGTFAIYYNLKKLPGEFDLQLIKLSAYLCSIAIEIERKQLQKVAETESKYHIITKNMTDLIKIVDKNYVVQYCSPSVKTVLGHEVEALEGTMSLNMIHPNDVPGAISVFNDVTKTKKSRKIEYRTKNAANQWICFEAVLTPLLKEDGQVEQVIIVSREISERKRAERLLKQREQRYKSLFMHNPDGVYSLDLNGHFVSVNDQVSEITGFSRAELFQMDNISFISESDRAKVCAHFLKAVRGVPQHFEMKVIQKSGNELQLQVKNIPIKIDGEIVGVYGIAKDVTEQIEARRDLEKSEMKFRSVVESASEAIIITDSKTRILSWNKAAKTIFGYTQSEALGKSLDFTLSKEYIEKNKDMIHLFMNNDWDQFIGRPIEITGLTKEGNEIPLEVSLNCWNTDEETYISAIVRDISERKRVESALQKSEEKFRHLIENLPEAVLIFSNQKLMYVNKMVLQLFGASSKKELYERPLLEFIDSESHDLIDVIRATLCEQYIVEDLEARLLTMSGDPIDVQINAAGTTYEGQKGAQIILRDITELKRSKELLINAEKMTAAGELAAGIAHEIRNPLTSIKGFIQLANTSNDNQERYYPIILTEIDRINTIISELLLLAKPKKTEFKKVSLKIILQDVLNLYSAQAILHNIEIINSINLEETEIIGHESKLKQVLINLFKNAVEAMPSGGTLEVDLRGTTSALILTIQDNGEGIPKSILSKIGQPFFTTKEKGTGLGLATCFSIIENHKGSMEIESEENKGTIITITLPRLKNY